MKYCVPPWMRLIEAEFNRDTQEVSGSENNPRIVTYHQATTLKASDDETPWCSSFANWVMQNCGVGFEGTKSAQAISWLNWGKEIMGRYGAIAVKNNGNGTGHVTFFLYADEDGYGYFIGGNQSNQVCIARYPLDDYEFRWPNSFSYG
ncbi:MAG: TIGR02594 family protein [Methanoregula sp.]